MNHPVYLLLVIKYGIDIAKYIQDVIISISTIMSFNVHDEKKNRKKKKNPSE